MRSRPSGLANAITFLKGSSGPDVGSQANCLGSSYLGGSICTCKHGYKPQAGEREAFGQGKLFGRALPTSDEQHKEVSGGQDTRLPRAERITCINSQRHKASTLSESSRKTLQSWKHSSSSVINSVRYATEHRRSEHGGATERGRRLNSEGL